MPSQPAPIHDAALKPPARLSPRQRELFLHIVGAVDPYHFSKSDLPLLAQYVGACDLCEQAQGNLDQEGAVIAGKANPWIVILEKASRSCVALSARLRLAPQSRFDRLRTGVTSRPQDGIYYEGDDGDPDDPSGELLARPTRPKRDR